MKPQVEQIKKLHSEFEESKKKAVQHATNALAIAIEIGAILTEQKEALPHGTFGEWIETNFRFTARTARRWMKLHAQRGRIEGAESINEAYKLLSEKAIIKERKSDSMSVLEEAFYMLSDWIWVEYAYCKNPYLCDNDHKYLHYLKTKIQTGMSEPERGLIKESLRYKNSFIDGFSGFGSHFFQATEKAKTEVMQRQGRSQSLRKAELATIENVKKSFLYIFSII